MRIRQPLPPCDPFAIRPARRGRGGGVHGARPGGGPPPPPAPGRPLAPVWACFGPPLPPPPLCSLEAHPPPPPLAARGGGPGAGDRPPLRGAADGLRRRAR